MSSSQLLLDAAGRRRSPVATPGFRSGIPPRNKGQRYPADPPSVDEIVAVMRQAGDTRQGHRLTALIVVLWRRAAAQRGTIAHGDRSLISGASVATAMFQLARLADGRVREIRGFLDADQARREYERLAGPPSN